MFDLDRLRALHAVATHGSLQAAAEVLHVSPSAVSQQIAKLEREVGEPLLERRGRGVALTDAASVLSHHAERALSVLRQAEAELDSRRREVAGRLSIGAFSTAARGLAPAALGRLAAAHPRLEVELHEMEAPTSLPMLVRGDLDLAVMVDWVNAPLPLPEGLERAPLADDIADIALPRAHRLAGRDPVRLAELAGEDWITWPAGSICHDWLLHALRSRGREPRIRHTASEYATQLALVAAGLGVAVLPRLGRGPVPEEVHVVRADPVLTRHVYAVWRADAARRVAILAAVDAFAAAQGPSASARPTRGRRVAATSTSGPSSQTLR